MEGNNDTISKLSNIVLLVKKISLIRLRNSNVEPIEKAEEGRILLRKHAKAQRNIMDLGN